MKKQILLLLFTCLLWSFTRAQQQTVFTRADTLRGSLSSLRSCYDVNYYHLDVKFDIAKKFISGSNQFKFTATQDFSRLQFDLFSNLAVEKVLYKGKELPFTREYNAVFTTFPQAIKKGAKDEFTVFYSGNPTIAQNAPWDGGIVFTTDSLGKPWVATACEGIGASIWWPTKDHLSDEPDSALISISVPDGLKDVSNGRLRKVTPLGNGYTRFDWMVSNPINNYNIEANIGDYAHFSDMYSGEKGPLSLDYWVLPYHLEKARKQFEANVKPMLKSFEYWFGPYPFYEDGYKLIETSHLGMEHQSGVAYGNKYMNGYLGRDLSKTGLGLDWDYIVVHESGHEWFGNNITAKDLADMWVHEGFTDYSEALFVESQKGKEAGAKYVKGLRPGIKNQSPVIGKYDVNNEGSGDMYNKGANILHTIRTIIDNDQKWRDILRGLNKTFYHQTVTSAEVEKYISRQAGIDLSTVFDQYLRYSAIPLLEYKVESGSVLLRWKADAPGFTMPVKVRTTQAGWTLVDISKDWKKTSLQAGVSPVADDNFYINVAPGK